MPSPVEATTALGELASDLASLTFFSDRVLACHPFWIGTHYVTQAG